MNIDTFPDPTTEVISESDSPTPVIKQRSIGLLHLALNGEGAEDLQNGSRFCTLLVDPISRKKCVTLFDRERCPHAGSRPSDIQSTRPFILSADYPVKEIVKGIILLEPTAKLVCDESSVKELFGERQPEIEDMRGGTLPYEDECGDLTVHWVKSNPYLEANTTN